MIEEYKALLKVVREISVDNSFSGDMKILHESISLLTLQIRKDILGNTPQIGYSENKINKMISEISKSTIFNNNG
ncbi:MAG: hypothetical protein L3J59_11070 [Methylococcaceae bacterium]|nr:hypothetical protein [Methylococcaceae bacterium]